MKKVGYLFGAGAEVGYQLCGGEEFAKIIIKIRDKNDHILNKEDEISNAVDVYYQKKYGQLARFKEWYPSYVKSGFRIDYAFKHSIHKKRMMNNLDPTLGSKTYLDRELEKYTSDEERMQHILEYPSYIGILDENFHTLISPRILGPNKFWRVLSAYTRAYLLLISRLLSIEKREELQELLENPINAMKLFLDEIHRNEENPTDLNYYRVLKKYKNEYKLEDLKIITTNYTPIVSEVCGIDTHKIAHIHGKFGWFENPRTLQVYDINDPDFNEEFQNDILFPYIFLQSGIKPIVEGRLVEEFHKMNKYLNEIEELIIVGFQFNDDDNHINSMLHHFIKEKKTITFFNFKHSFSDKIAILNKLRLDSNFESSIHLVEINEENQMEEFEKVVAERMKIEKEKEYLTA